MITRKKISYTVDEAFAKYLRHYKREAKIPAIYEDLLGFSAGIPYEDPSGNETLWLTVMYNPETMDELRPKLALIYSRLKSGGASGPAEHLMVDRIDFGEFGNSRPFRIRITNRFNDNSDYFYVKRADASRLFGLELEHLLSPERINYLVRDHTLIEEHIAGLPGDMFIKDYMQGPDLNRVRLAKEFVKFNERCFIRLLGDMRSVNYTVDITPDFEEVQFRVRPIDFDQQSYNGKSKVYLAYRFDSNRPVNQLVVEHLNRRTISQYQKEERAQMGRRAYAEQRRLNALLSVMRQTELAPQENVVQLRSELAELHESSDFEQAWTMGDLVATNIKHLIY